MPRYPSEVVYPPPRLVYGTKKLVRAYAGDAHNVANTHTGELRSIGFIGDVLDTDDQDDLLSPIVTFSTASPTVVTESAHGLSTAEQIRFETSGTLPTGVVFEGAYWKSSAGAASGSYQIADSPARATAGTPSINVTAQGTGVHRRTGIGRVFQVFDQSGGGYDIAQTVGVAPKISTLSLGSSRAWVFDGNQLENGTTSVLCSLNFPLLSDLELSAREYSIYAVYAPPASLYINQADLAINQGIICSFETASGSVIQVYVNRDAGPGAVAVTDNNGFIFEPQDWTVEIGPTVLAIVSSSRGVEIFQNEVLRHTASRSAITDPIVTGYLGKRGSSVAGAQSKSGAFAMSGFMFFKEGHSQQQRMDVSASLYEFFS